MDYNQPFSLLNEKLRPRVTTSEQLYSSLNRVEERQLGSLRGSSSSYRPTILPAEPEREDPEESEDDGEQRDMVCNGPEGPNCADLLSFDMSCLIPELSRKDLGEEELMDDSGSIKSEEKDSQGELTTDGMRDSSRSGHLASEGEDSLQRSYLNGTLPDLLKNGRPLSRRRTLGHVSETLNEVRKEVQLSRRRSIKLKAQVDKLQGRRDGPGWSQHRERVTEEVLSVLRLLHPLTEPQSSMPEPSAGENCLDDALAQLQTVARTLAISHTKQFKPGKGAEDSAILQQALRDRDEAIEKKKAMEDELLRSKTDMMTLNNQLLEAVQKRLEMSLELEAWKEDFQLVLHQQIQSQYQAEQDQKKPSRLGLLRRKNKPLNQRPSNFPLSAPTLPMTNSNQIFVSSNAFSSAPPPSTPPNTQRTWRDKLRGGKFSRNGEDAAGQDPEFGRDDKGFQVVSLD
ncbi:bicaudal-D-related protein 2-like isoform X2 [Echeneis naucrates]|uniref:bicaudal-D-related protein 2-like isoform X2 n=1 Tax=Echeneis naucrates TaxID=173247 RepID=UPI0011138F01|nr:BICD family-like cargo adapter 2 isoform X2 [Echeneis naucrates]